MPVEPRGVDLNLSALLAAVEKAPPSASVDVLAAELAARMGAQEMSFLITDLSGHFLVRLVTVGREPGAGGVERPEEVPLEQPPYWQVIRTQEPQVSSEGRQVFVTAPVTNRGDVIGVLELVLEHQPGPEILQFVAEAGLALAYVVIANRRFTDLYEWGRRTAPFTLAAEIQHGLLPKSTTCEAGQFTLAAGLEPTEDIGGDTFDYALDRNTLHVSITDAMGHEEKAALLATLLVGALRNGRRCGVKIVEQAQRANSAVAAHGDGDSFVTGLVLRVDLATGRVQAVVAGHPLPLLLRGGEVRAVELETGPPFGVLGEAGYQVQRLCLEPGDRMILLTDGMLERNAARVDVARLLVETQDFHPREVVRSMLAAVLDATKGRLRDDATVLCLEWQGGGSKRNSPGPGGDDEEN
ncbi:PP2C family protein-serine/threonine phosphatase [soil metagenome]